MASKHKLVAALVVVDCTGVLAMRVPESWTDKQIEECALENFFPSSDNCELNDPLRVADVHNITQDEFDRLASKGQGLDVVVDD